MKESVILMKDSDRVDVICHDCRQDMTICYGKFRKYKNIDHIYRCKKCMNLYKKGIYENKSEEEKRIIQETCSKNSIAYHSSLDKEGKEEFSLKIKEGLNNRSDEEKDMQKINISNAQKNNWDLLNKEERLIKMEPLFEGNRIYNENLTEEQKLIDNTKVSEGLIEYYSNLTLEEYQSRCIQSAINHNINLDKLTSSRTECMFANDLNSLNIDFNTQYSSIKIHKDFNKLFPYNPIRNSKLINPTHNWDFIIYTKQGNILVDIDGYFHNKDEHPYTKFNDSQRIYQTDGLDSYIVLCNDGKIDNDTIVYNINNKVYLTYKELLNHIQIMNK